MITCRISLAALGLFLLCVGQAAADRAPLMGYNGAIPSCTIPEPEAGQSVSVITAEDKRSVVPAEEVQNTASVHFGEPTRVTSFATISVKRSDLQHYLVLQSDRQIVWNITGDVDSIARVVVLGAAKLGPWGAGVIGVPQDRVTFPEPVRPELDYGFDTPCGLIVCACLAAQWFGLPPGDDVTFLPPSTQGRFDVAGWVEPRSVRNGVSDWPVMLRPFAQSETLVTVDPASVVSLRPALPYDQPAAQAGLDALVASGALLATGDPGHRAAVAAYGEAFSARYRTRFNPDFRFEPQVDYVVTQPITLPADTPAHVFLLAPGVPLPDLNGNEHNPICFLVADLAGAPVTKSTYVSPFCREVSFLDDAFTDRRTYSAAREADAVVTGDHCHLPGIMPEAEVVAVWVDEARNERTGDTAPREIAIDVAGANPVILYLQTNGGNVRWIVNGHSVVQVFSPRWPYGLPVEVVLNGAPHEVPELAGRMEGCLIDPPPRLLDGPGYLHLDKLVTTLLGRPIDRLLEVDAPGFDPARVVVAADSLP